MGRRPHADDRPARFDILDDVLHLLVGQVAEARGDNHQVGRLEALPGRGCCRVWLGSIVPSLVDGEQHGAFETVMLGQDLAQLRQRLLGAILLVAADQDDVLALAHAERTLVDHPRVVGRTLAPHSSTASTTIPARTSSVLASTFAPREILWDGYGRYDYTIPAPRRIKNGVEWKTIAPAPTIS